MQASTLLASGTHDITCSFVASLFIILHFPILVGQFFRKGVEIDAARKLLLLPNKDPVPVMRKPVWAYMEHNVPSDQLCWVAMNPGYQGHHLIDGHYLDYVVDDVLSTNFEYKCKHE